MDAEDTEIFRLLPRIDCGQCPAGTCMAFAKATVEDRRVLSQCERLTEYGLMMIEALLCSGR